MSLALLIAGILFSSGVAAVESYIVGRDWLIPVEREDGTTLPLVEIDHHVMYRVSCADGVHTGDIIYLNIYSALTISYWTSNTAVDCFVMTTTDTDGRVSKYSEVFQATEWNSPNPPACGLLP